MTVNPALERQFKRWYPLIDIDEQVRLITEERRFKVVPAGRRSGKTERFKRFISKAAMTNADEKYFAAAPTYGQAKKIFWDDLKALTFSSMHAKPPSESELKIYMPNGTELHVIGLDKPQRFEGIPWTGGGIDEIADLKKEAWAENILPALNTVNPLRPDYRAWCWLFGVPDGLNHFYDLAEYARLSGDPQWGFYHWKSAQILPADVIESARRVMSLKQFKQEFEASFETASGRIYEDYGGQNYTNDTIKPHEQLMWMHDFNYTPLSSAVGVRRNNALFVLDEVVLESAVARQSALEFVEKFKNHGNKNVLIYGDASGRAGEKHNQESNYTEIEKVLREHGWTYTRKVKKANGPIRERQNALRAKIMNAAGQVSLFVNPTAAPYAHKGLATVQLKKGSTFIEEETEYQHITTALGYAVVYEWPIMTGGINRPIIQGV